MSEDLTKEWYFIHSILQGGSMSLLVARRLGIEAKHLGDGEEAKVYEFILTKRFLARTPDAKDIFHATGVVVPECEDECDVEIFGPIVRDFALYRQISNSAMKIMTDARDNPLEARDKLRELIRDTGWVQSGSVDRTNNPGSIQEIRKNYERAEAAIKSGILLGLPSPWPAWDARSLGLQPGKMLVLAGKREQGKTLLSLVWANYLWNHGLMPGENILYVSMEMDPVTLKQRLFAIRNRLDYQSFRIGDLKREEADRFYEFCEEFEDKPDPSRPEIILAYSSTVRSVGHIADLCVEYKPKAVFIDGLYILSNGVPGNAPMWEKTLRAAESVKLELANTLMLPVVVTTQIAGSKEQNDFSANADSLGYAKAIADYADILLGIFSDEKMRADNERLIKCLKGREFKPIYWKIRADMKNQNYDEIEWFEDDPTAKDDDPPISTTPSSRPTGRRAPRAKP